MTAPAFPWRRVMQLGLGLLRLPPRDFWAMTPRELEAALSAYCHAPAARLERTALEALMMRFPDGRG